MASLVHLLDALAMQKIATPKPMGVLSCACTDPELGHLHKPQVEIIVHDLGNSGQALDQWYPIHVRWIRAQEEAYIVLEARVVAEQHDARVGAQALEVRCVGAVPAHQDDCRNLRPGRSRLS